MRNERACEIGMALDNLRIYLGWQIDAIRNDGLSEGEDWLQIKFALEDDAKEIGNLIEYHVDRTDEEEGD